MACIERNLKRMCLALALIGSGVLTAHDAGAVDFGGLVKKATSSVAGGARDKVTKEVNARLLAEGRKNQCSFKSDSDELEPGCDAKLRNLTSALVEAKKRMKVAGVTSYKFEVSGHTDSSGSASHNKELSGRRAAKIASELVARGIARDEIISVGMGAERPVVTPDDTLVKKARNRRYEIQLRF